MLLFFQKTIYLKQTHKGRYKKKDQNLLENMHQPKKNYRQLNMFTVKHKNKTVFLQRIREAINFLHLTIEIPSTN